MSGLPIDDTCLDLVEVECATCRRLRTHGPREQRFVVAPADGGGWRLWSTALLRFLTRLGPGPTHAVVISQEIATERYVQLQIGHGIAHAETSSNVYLTGVSRLTADEEATLGLLGWLPPALDHDEPDEMPANWTLPLVHGEWVELVDVLASTVIGVLGFSERLPVGVHGFLVHHPCRDCSWPPDDHEPGGV
jgi:hypothetical protein